MALITPPLRTGFLSGRVRTKLGLVFERDLPPRFPAVVHEAHPSVIRSTPPLKEEAVDPFARDECLAGLWHWAGRWTGSSDSTQQDLPPS
jgi:hypothetical protein